LIQLRDKYTVKVNNSSFYSDNYPSNNFYVSYLLFFLKSVIDSLSEAWPSSQKNFAACSEGPEVLLFPIKQILDGKIDIYTIRPIILFKLEEVALSLSSTEMPVQIEKVMYT